MNKGIRQGNNLKIDGQLKRNPKLANTLIAELTGTSMQTVEKRRALGEELGEIPIVETFVRRDGKTTPRSYKNIF